MRIQNLSQPQQSQQSRSEDPLSSLASIAQLYAQLKGPELQQQEQDAREQHGNIANLLSLVGLTQGGQQHAAQMAELIRQHDQEAKEHADQLGQMKDQLTQQGQEHKDALQQSKAENDAKLAELVRQHDDETKHWQQQFQDQNLKYLISAKQHPTGMPNSALQPIADSISPEFGKTWTNWMQSQAQQEAAPIIRNLAGAKNQAQVDAVIPKDLSPDALALVTPHVPNFAPGSATGYEPENKLMNFDNYVAGALNPVIGANAPFAGGLMSLVKNMFNGPSSDPKPTNPTPYDYDVAPGNPF